MTDVIGPQVIQDVPIPILDTSTPTANNIEMVNPNPSSIQGEAASSSPIKNNPNPAPPISTETIADALDTKSRRILGTFTFGQVGAIKIGEYVAGVSGEIDISPNGITAKNVNDETTFSIDATTGDATFKGTIQAADFTIIDSQGLVSLSAFTIGNAHVTSFPIFPNSSSSYVDIAGSSITFTLGRAVNVLFLLNVYGQFISMTNANESIASVALNIDGVRDTIFLEMADVILYTPGYSTNTSREWTLAGQAVKQLAAGSHTIKAQCAVTTTDGAEYQIYDLELTYLTLGS